MHDRISVHSVCFPTAGVDELLEHWAALGAKRVSFSSGQLLGLDLPVLRLRLERAGHHAESITHLFCEGTLRPEAADMAGDRARLAEAIANARAIGARSIYMLTGGRGDMDWEQAAQAFAAAIEPALPLARDAGVALSIENTTPLYAHLHLGNTLRDTITLAEMAGIGVCIDYFACWTEAGMRDQIRRAMRRCVLVQVSDYVLGDRALPCRAVPGDGAIPWRRVLGWMLEERYSGAFDLELIGPRIDAEGQLQAVQRAAAHIGQLLEEFGA